MYLPYFPAASEFRSWTLFYALPVLKGILDEAYLNHFALFSEALWLLLQTSPSLEDISKAERLLQHFCFKFPAYYGWLITVQACLRVSMYIGVCRCMLILC